MLHLGSCFLETPLEEGHHEPKSLIGVAHLGTGLCEHKRSFKSITNWHKWMAWCLQRRFGAKSTFEPEPTKPKSATLQRLMRLSQCVGLLSTVSTDAIQLEAALEVVNADTQAGIAWIDRLRLFQNFQSGWITDARQGCVPGAADFP